MKKKMKHRIWSPLAVLAALATGLLTTQATGAEQEEAVIRAPTPLSLEWCLGVAARSNPEIAIDVAAADAATRRIRPAGSLEDPRVGYSALNIPVSSFDLSSTPMSGQQIDLKQKLPFPGFLKNRAASARAGAAAANESVEDRTLRIAAAVEAHWAELGFAQRALEITDSNIDLLRQLTAIAEAKYRVGAGLQQDVIRAQVEFTLLMEERLRRVASVRVEEAQMAALLDLSSEVDFPRTADLRDPSALPDLDPLLERLSETSPQLRAFAMGVEEAERAHRATQLESYPDVDVGVGYRIRNDVRGDPVSGDDFFSAGFTLRLPVDRGKWRERVAERGALIRRAKAAYRNAQAKLRHSVRASFAHLQRASDEVALLETGLVPQARQSLASNRSGYQVDKVDFLNLIDSQVKLLNAELSLIRAVADRRAAFASLESAVGEELR